MIDQFILDCLAGVRIALAISSVGLFLYLGVRLGCRLWPWPNNATLNLTIHNPDGVISTVSHQAASTPFTAGVGND
jgi:hypothetical protein